ncbi:MAG TPA: crosslink repair DNA glycosylase YcaQ family protein [Candidatus Limnocylindrales bacterium]|nr:crosslink repair DNA glycosylase YcaQ family protein [Candidatus Limnocylindrales bacterium]
MPRTATTRPRPARTSALPDTAARSSVRQTTADVARRYLALWQLLAPPRSLPAEADSVMRVMERIGSLQFDPLSIAGRNHDLVLGARIAGYRPAWTDALLYKQRLLFEAWNKGLSILPTSELPWYRHAWDRDRAWHERSGTFETHDGVVEQVLARIRAEGPLSAIDFEQGPAIEWYWRPTNTVRAVLEALAEVGVLGIARRSGNRRHYDLAERLFPPELLAAAPREPAEQLRHKLLSRYRAHGLLGKTGAYELFQGIDLKGSEKGRFAVPPRDRLRADLVERGDLVPLAVEGLRGVRYLPAAGVPLLDQAEREVAAGTPPGGHQEEATFLAPLDPLVWDRDFLRRLYSFDYIWEVYVPAAKRRWGYYVLPILFGDRLVGRIEPRIERAEGVVRILGLWWEPGVAPRRVEGLVPAMRRALTAYRRFADARRVEWAPGLEAAGRLFGSGRARG